MILTQSLDLDLTWFLLCTSLLCLLLHPLSWLGSWLVALVTHWVKHRMVPNSLHKSPEDQAQHKSIVTRTYCQSPGYCLPIQRRVPGPLFTFNFQNTLRSSSPTESLQMNHGSKSIIDKWLPLKYVTFIIVWDLPHWQDRSYAIRHQAKQQANRKGHL